MLITNKISFLFHDLVVNLGSQPKKNLDDREN
jgi:hypothetical protein